MCVRVPGLRSRSRSRAVRSRRFLVGVGVEFLTTLGVGVGFFCPTPDVQVGHFSITLLNWEFLSKWYNSLRNFCWNRGFLLRGTISSDFNIQISIRLCVWEILERRSRIFYLRLHNPGEYVHFLQAKSKNRNRMTGETLDDSLRLAAANTGIDKGMIV